MFLLPYRTDAPCHHPPLATFGIIGTCTVVFLLCQGGSIDPQHLILTYGHGLHPTQWVTSMFAHAGWGHLIFNMIFLFVFGLVVEGKVGAWKFLLIYLSIGVVQGAIQQVLFLGAHGGGSLGASAAIFGLIAIAWMWAPKNDVYMIYFFFFRGGVTSWTIQTTAILYIVVDLIWSIVFATMGMASSSLLHIMGVAVGLPIGIWMLKSGLVDCENWDWFSVRQNLHRKSTLVARRPPIE